jgi:AcrR family transcriptional regulator
MATASRESAPRAPSPFRAALIDLCFERGFAALTVDDLCDRAGLDRAVFFHFHTDLEDCFFQICGAELRRYRHLAALARAGLGDWRDRLRATVYALYRYLDSDERLRRFAVVEIRAAGERSALLIGSEIEGLFELIDEGRSEPTAAPSLTRATAESIGGGIFNEIYTAAAHEGPMPAEEEVVPQLMYSAVLPYLGATVAVEELHIPPPQSAGSRLSSTRLPGLRLPVN